MKKLFSRMNKTLRKIVLGVLIAAVACGAVWGSMTLIRNARRGAVNVYPATDFCMTDYWGDSSETYGMVTTDRLQKVYVSDTQTVREVFVKEGQNVRKGDKLLSYDTTLNDLDLKRAQIALEKQELALDSSKKELEYLQKAKSLEELEKEKAELEEKLRLAKLEASGINPADPPTFPTNGTGTSASDPIYVKWEGSFSQQQLLAAMGEKTEAYILTVELQDGEYVPRHGFHITVGEDNAVQVEFNDDMSLPEKQEPDPTDAIRKLEKELREVQLLLDEALDKDALLRRIAELRQQIGEQEISLKLATLNLKKLKAEVQDGVVYSEIDGTVKAVRSANEAYAENAAVVEVSGGGGYYITGSVSELSLGTVSVGQAVNINSWMTGASCEGEVVEIGTYPTDDTGWSSGNNNVSWYPLKVFVSEDADLREGDYVNMTYQADMSSGSSWWLESMFIRTENGKSYVLLRGENGTLEKRWVQTGRDLWGSYTEIRGGMTTEDFVAFPYGQGVEPGAKTTESSAQEFYNYY